MHSKKDNLSVGSSKRKLHFISGFSFVELMISIAIFTMLTSLLVFNQATFNNHVNTDSLAHQIAQWVRDAQISSMGVRKSKILGVFAPGYGLHFSASVPDQFIYYVDSNGNGVYDSGSDSIEQTVKLLQGYKITLICGRHSGIPVDTTCGGYGQFAAQSFSDISFKRPNPDANIYGDNIAGSSVYSPLRITITAPQGYSRTVVVYVTGQVSIE